VSEGREDVNSVEDARRHILAATLGIPAWKRLRPVTPCSRVEPAALQQGATSAKKRPDVPSKPFRANSFVVVSLDGST
jgi:hypothetical protein